METEILLNDEPKAGMNVEKKKDINVKIITAKIKLAKGPANITAALCHLGLVSNKLSSCSSVNCFLISGSASKAFLDK